MQVMESINDKKMFILVAAIVLLITFGSSITRIYGFLNIYSFFSFVLLFFLMGIITCSVGHIYFPWQIRRIYQGLGSVKIGIIKNIFTHVFAIQFFIAGLLTILLYQVLSSLSFSTILITGIFVVSYSLGINNLITVSWKFTGWLMTKRNYVLAVNTLAVVAILANVIFALLMVVDGLPYQPTSIESTMGPVYYSFKSIFGVPYQVSSIFSFVCIWIATIVLLKSYVNKLGKVRFSILITLPIIYFLAQFQPYLFEFLLANYQSESSNVIVIYTTIISLNKTIGAILFGFAFWSTSKKINQKAVKRLMNIAAYGLILLITSNQATSLLNYSFPPFGILSVSFLGISSYMFLIGLYSSALSVANDLQLRKLVRKSVAKEFAFVSSMADAEMEERITRQIVRATKTLSHALVKETGIESTVGDKEMLEYVSKAIAEVKKSKNAMKNP